ncbi:GNAT family N-acetyltransferase [Aliiglaciecola litoralis]|uniref:GNAT family N-acetyltransferase n=1 Tax=Aliiglaciecola litoralis TaxID=582857 RepID=A0ABN1LER4_9ALTE
MKETDWQHKTARLRLRKFSMQDRQFVISLVNDPQWIAHIGDRNVHDETQAEAFIKDGPLSCYRNHGFGMYIFESLTDNTPMGVCGLLQRDYLDKPDIGYAILPQFRGQGLTFEACQGVLQHDVSRYSLDTVYATISPLNKASIKLIERLGFEFSKLIEPTNQQSLLYIKRNFDAR